jgi:hypothetical protein
VLPLLYLQGLSSNDLVPALRQFLGTSAGLPAATVTLLTAQWQDEARGVAAGVGLRGLAPGTRPAHRQARPTIDGR